MKIHHIDHLVITTQNLNRCLAFYVGVLGMEHRERQGRHSLHFGNCKISVHTRKGEYLPAAGNPQYGSQDFCLIVDDIEAARAELESRGYPIEAGIAVRNGAEGEIRSLYLYDPDGNLVELSQYE